MRPNLSLDNIATVIAALGTSAVLAACTKAAEPGSVRSDQPAASAVNANAPPPPPAATAATPEGVAADEELKKKAGPGGGGGSASATPLMQQPRSGGGMPHGSSTGQASCGAGTCTADPKKK